MIQTLVSTRFLFSVMFSTVPLGLYSDLQTSFELRQPDPAAGVRFYQIKNIYVITSFHFVPIYFIYVFTTTLRIVLMKMLQGALKELAYTDAALLTPII